MSEVCKTCGTCPTCNSKPYWHPHQLSIYPVVVQPYSQPYWYSPTITSGTTTQTGTI